MTTIYFAGQDNFGNRGCEALIRSNVKLIREQFPGATFLVPSRGIDRDAAQWPCANELGVEFIAAEPIPSAIRWWSRGRRFIWKGLDSYPPKYGVSEQTHAAILRSDALIMTGGDIISLDYGLESLHYWARICEIAMDAGKKSVLWAGSVGPFSSVPSLESRMRELLSRFDLITVRETPSLEYLEKLKIKGVELVADPAFCLDIEEAPNDELGIFLNGPVLGFNVSPLIRKFRQDDASKEALDREVVAFLDDVLRTTEFSILLIPHVDPLHGGEENSDYAYMNKLLDALSPALVTSGRVKLLRRGFNAGQIKDVIRRCDCFMGARTHATIAALSRQVPTTSIAYSVKAKGINQDLFGHTRYVLDTPNVTAASLRDQFNMLQKEGDKIRAVLAELLPAWKQRARKSAELLGGLVSSDYMVGRNL
ncbi:MAG: polysaccharide pyruvyl transferase family protein [Pseudomonadota bacterium]